MKKIKIFLGGYLNCTNAQNLNCRSIAKLIDKEKFDIFGLGLYSGDLPELLQDNLKIYKCSYPHKIFKYFGYLWGIFQCDIAYLPKGECHKWNFIWMRLLRKKSFSTIEGILDETNMKKSVQINGSKTKVLKQYKDFNRLYSITSYLRKYNFLHHGVESTSKILYLGTDTCSFTIPNRIYGELKNIIIIGNHLKYKGIQDYFILAKKYPRLIFHIVGSGNGEIDINLELNKLKLSNCIYHGALNHQQIKKVLQDVQLHIFPSRTEGFPKVILETAAAGVPSLLYSDYGANEWIDDHYNGFVVDTVDQIQTVIDKILVDPEILSKISRNAIDLAKSFDWKVLIKDWEKEILTIVNTK